MTDFKIEYSLSIPEPHKHYVHVSMSIKNIHLNELILTLPVWTPGSYLVREYAKNITKIDACSDDSKKITLNKIAKNRWKVATNKVDTLHLSYKVYANEDTVRTSFVDADRAHLIPASLFLYIEGHSDLPSILQITPPKSWKEISTALKRKGNQKWTRAISNYDELVDSPIEIGNQEVIKFKAGGIPHQLALVGQSNANKTQMLKDLKRIIDESVRLMGDHPCDRFLFILQYTNNRYNGLEHLSSTSCQLPRWDFYPKEKYQQSMGLLSHEYFHLWNVKRFRPVSLGPFDYSKENYTSMLWFVEGATSYYDDYLLYKAEIFKRQEYFDVLAKVLTHVVNTPGDSIQSLTDASFDAWIKYYRQNENSANTEVSYYKKGATIVEVLNFIILKESNGKYSFDDVMRSLYGDFKKSPEKGYEESDLINTIEKFAGKSIKSFYNNHIDGVKPVDYKKYFAIVGLDLIDRNAKSNEINWGWKLKIEDNVTVASLNSKYAAAKYGINVGDEIIAINGFRVDKNYTSLLERVVVDETIKVLINRQGILKEIEVRATKNEDVDFNLIPVKKPTKIQKKLLSKWLD